MYVKLDHDLIPRKIEDIQSNIALPGQKRKKEAECFEPSTFNVNKYALKKGNLKNFLQKIHQKSGNSESEKKSETGTEIVAGTEIENLYFDHDLGFFSAILACYNNHWILRTSPDDWWNVIVRNVAQTIDENGDKPKVRNFFVDFQGKKEIKIKVGYSLATINYDWLFDQFSNGKLRENWRRER